MEQIFEYKYDPGNAYTRTLPCFLRLLIVSNRTETFYFANNNPLHFAFHADERSLPIYEFADEDHTKITRLDGFAAAFLVKCTQGTTLARYMVLIANEPKVFLMRAYQVYTVKQIVSCIHQDCGTGSIWSTAGSMTSNQSGAGETLAYSLN